MKNNPDVLISVIVPVYNRPTVIHRSINSIKAQTFKRWECIIVDDNSTDQTKEVVKAFVSNDSRFIVLDNKRKKGAQGARNTGIIASQGEFVVLFDSDNVMHPSFLEKVYHKLLKEKTDICSCFSRIIEDHSGLVIGYFRWVGNGLVHKSLLNGKSYFDNSSTLIRKQKLFDIGLLDEDCPAFQEFDTHIRLSNISEYSTLKEELIDYYRGGNDTISKSKERSVLGQLYILKKYNNEFRRISPYSFFKRNLYLYADIKEIKNKEDRIRLKRAFEKETHYLYIVLFNMIYRIKRCINFFK